MPENTRFRRSSANLIFSYALITVMMVCLAHFTRQVLSWLIPQTSFGFLVPLCFFIAIEAILSEHTLMWVDVFTTRWLIHRLVEWVVLIVLVKLSTYFSLSFERLASDLLIWDEQLSAFFNVEFVFALAVAFLVWQIASMLANRLLLLFSSQEHLDLELEGINLIDRSSLRRKLLSQVFILGGLMLAITTALKTGAELLPLQYRSAPIQYGVVLVYFICGLILLSQTQLFIKWSRWYLQRIPTTPSIWWRWIVVSVLLIAGTTLIANLLPTDYSFNLLGILQIGLGYVIYLVTFLQFLLFYPFVLLLNYLSRLFNQPQDRIFPSPTPPPIPMAPPGETLSPSIWTELFRSILFWSIFFSIIFIAFRHYIQQNREIAETLRRQPYLKWAFQVWEWLKSLFNQTKAWTSEVAAAGRNLFKKSPKFTPAPRRASLPGYAKLAPRQQIRLTYLRMAEWSAEIGCPRHIDQSPAEYSRQFASRYPQAADEMQNLTMLFVAARYSPRIITSQESQTALRHWKSLQVIVRDIIEKAQREGVS